MVSERTVLTTPHPSSIPDPSSFRDPAGFGIREDGQWKRIVTRHGDSGYDALMRSGLYESLVQDRLLVAHTEEDISRRSIPGTRLLVPTQLDFISQPYEWCFSQLKDAALLTLQIQQRALALGLSLKDASAFNIQFHEGRPVFIDTLSFERAGQRPWIAYEQYCRHFLAPLLLMQSKSPMMAKILEVNLDGIPLDVASSMLGLSSYFQLGTLLHIHLHARAQKHGRRAPSTAVSGSSAQMRIVDSLRAATENINLSGSRSEWSDYTAHMEHYGHLAVTFKLGFVRRVLERTPPGLVYDLGGNTGTYSRLAVEHCNRCVLYEADPLCVEEVYTNEKARGLGSILPLVMDITNPTPAVGLNLTERRGVFDRPTGSLVLALALVHHLRLTHNIPFQRIAETLARFGRTLIVEYVEPDDPMASQLLAHGRQIPDDYSLDAFLAAFAPYFRLLEQAPIPGMRRRLMVFQCLH